MNTDKKYSIGEISRLAGISRRSVRFYVQKGLLAPPCGAGRGHYYTEAHLQRLIFIKTRQENGCSLEEIADGINPGNRPQKESALAREEFVSFQDLEEKLWLRVLVAPGLELNLESGFYRLTPGRIKKLQKAVRDIFGGDTIHGEKNTEEDTHE